MEIDPNVDSMEGSSDSGPETLENSSSIGKEKISKKGIRVGGRKGKKNQNVGHISKNMSLKMGRKGLDASIVVIVMQLTQKRILSFSQIVDHMGDSIGKCIENVLIEWGIDKVFTIIVDNATANTTAIGYVIRKLNSWQDGGAVLEGNALKLRKAFQQMGEEDIQYVNYFRDKEDGQKRIGPLTLDDCDNAKCTIRNQLNSLTSERDPLVSKIAVSMQQKFDKYWGGLEKTNNLLIVAVVLDPRYKLGYVKFRFDSIYGVEESQSMISKVKGVLLDLDEWYNKFYGSSGGGAKETDDVFSIGVGGGASDDLELGRLKATDKEDSLWGMKQQEEDINKGKSEMDLYLLERAEKLNDSLGNICGTSSTKVAICLASSKKIQSQNVEDINLVYSSDVYYLPVSMLK
ncbi:hypothetical protein LWI29_027138 [Acer saccharum]|uniref:hAT-like transposase RNase-H fold domain-containing protein n=1 Tax=Acer saccharum TaxID=4024 RepID=A0AA39SR97_ACESA|nr:hypothetical protein LWI29_027138 [Acer saccharum]